MKGLAWMVAGSLGVLAAIAPWLSGPARVAALLGLLGPLVIAGVSWLVIERTHRVRPASVMSVMTVGFGLKVLFVGVYVSVVLGLLAVDRLAFVWSFTGYFIALYVVEALLLRRLFAGGLHAPGSSQDL